MTPSQKAVGLAAIMLSTGLASAGCSGEPVVEELEEHNKAAVRRYFAALNEGNVRFADEYLAPEYAYHGSMGTLSREQFLDLHEEFSKAFSGGQATIDDLIAEGDRVVARYTIRATHTGALQGIPPTGKSVTVTGIIVSRFENGLEAEAWEQLDMMSLMQQLGAVPGADQGAEAPSE